MLNPRVCLLVVASLSLLIAGVGCGDTDELQAQPGTVAGTVTLEQSEDSAGVEVTLGDDSVTTQEDGGYEFTGLSQETVELSADHEDYVAQSKEVEIVAGETVEADFHLQPDNEAPVIESFEVDPTDWIESGGTAQLTVEATDPDGDELIYEYAVSDGWDIDGEGAEVELLAPTESMAETTVEVTVVDVWGATDSATLDVRTQDTEPDAIVFEDQEGVPVQEPTISNAVEVDGFEGTVGAECSNCQVAVNGGEFDTEVEGIEVGDSIELRVISGESAQTVTSYVTVGETQSEQWSVTSLEWEDRIFDTCGNDGRTGPSESDCDDWYAGTALDGEVNLIEGIQEWEVPYDGTYRIDVRGAGGGDNEGQQEPEYDEDQYEGAPGARMRGDVELSQGDVLRILVGQEGGESSGGGGTFVVRTVDDEADVLDDAVTGVMFDDIEVETLVIAGGGGGASDPDFYGYGGEAQPGLTGEAGGQCADCDDDAYGEGGVDGEGGEGTDNLAGAEGGGGFLSDGASPSGRPDVAGQGFLFGGLGGVHAWDDDWAEWTEPCNGDGGGFGGGGGCGYPPENPGGAGGFSGGGGSWGGGSGGGGSFNIGEDQNNIEGENDGHGEVIIELRAD